MQTYFQDQSYRNTGQVDTIFIHDCRREGSNWIHCGWSMHGLLLILIGLEGLLSADNALVLGGIAGLVLIKYAAG